MRIFLPCSSPWCVLRGAGRSGRMLVLLVVLGFILAMHTPQHAAEPPSKGGTILWAVHEGMPDFDIHYQGTYIAAQPIGPIYNGLLTFDVYDNEKIVGDLAERWKITEDGKRITFALWGICLTRDSWDTPVVTQKRPESPSLVATTLEA